MTAIQVTWLREVLAFRGAFSSDDARVRLPVPVAGFLLADPFVGAMALLPTHTVYRGLLWSLGILALTLVFGRVFCGWVCPFGTLHHFFGWIFPSRYLKGSKRVEANKTHSLRQSAKYYMMYAFLAAAVAGRALGGLFDPICVAVRAIGLGVIPAAQYVAGVFNGGQNKFAKVKSKAACVAKLREAMASVQAGHCDAAIKTAIAANIASHNKPKTTA